MANPGCSPIVRPQAVGPTACHIVSFSCTFAFLLLYVPPRTQFLPLLLRIHSAESKGTLVCSGEPRRVRSGKTENNEISCRSPKCVCKCLSLRVCPEVGAKVQREMKEKQYVLADRKPSVPLGRAVGSGLVWRRGREGKSSHVLSSSRATWAEDITHYNNELSAAIYQATDRQTDRRRFMALHSNDPKRGGSEAAMGGHAFFLSRSDDRVSLG